MIQFLPFHFNPRNYNMRVVLIIFKGKEITKSYEGIQIHHDIKDNIIVDNHKINNIL